MAVVTADKMVAEMVALRVANLVAYWASLRAAKLVDW